MLFAYFGEVDKLAAKQSAAFQNHSRTTDSDFTDRGFTGVLLPPVPVFQGTLSGLQLCNSIQ